MKTHCIQGHELLPNNVRFAGSAKNPRCRTCERNNMREYQKRRRVDNPERCSELRIDSHLRMRYALDGRTAREELLASQGNACAICGRTGCEWGQGFNDKWHVDHDHNNPEPNHRGVLCGRCNLVLGHMEQVGLEKFTTYLEAHK